MNPRWHTAWLISGLLFFGVATAEPKQLSDEEMTALAANVDKANSLFKKEKFVEALEIYQEAYNLTEEPTMLFSIAQCQRNLDKNKEASDNYRKFLQSSPPDNELRPLAEQLLAETEAKIPADKNKETKPPGKTSRYFFVGSGVAGAAGASFGVLALSSAKKSKEAQDEGEASTTINFFLQQTTLRSVVADACFVAAAGFGALGVLSLKKEKKEKTTLLLGPSQVTLSVEF